MKLAAEPRANRRGNRRARLCYFRYRRGAGPRREAMTENSHMPAHPPAAAALDIRSDAGDDDEALYPSSDG